jgi:hypothetical protein
MSQFDMSGLTRENMLSPDFYRQMATGLTSQAASLRDRYKPFQETYREPHHTFLGGLFGRKTTRTRTAYPDGYQQAMNDATGFENQALYYKALADYIEANPIEEAAPTEEELEALDPNGPDVDRGTLTIQVPNRRQDDQSPTINPFMAGGSGLRIPYGT